MSAVSRLVATLALGLAASVAHAQGDAFPQKPVKIVVPFTAGGSADFLGRLVAERLTALWGKPVIVENRPGANAQVGTDVAAKAAPDGMTMTVIELPHAVAPAVVAHLPYDMQRDFTPVAMLGASPLILFGGAGPGRARDAAVVGARSAGGYAGPGDRAPAQGSARRAGSPAG